MADPKLIEIHCPEHWRDEMVIDLADRLAMHELPATVGVKVLTASGYVDVRVPTDE